jgi:hypothetical protein
MPEVYRLAPIKPQAWARAPIFGSLIENRHITLYPQHVRLESTLNPPKPPPGLSMFDPYFTSDMHASHD